MQLIFFMTEILENPYIRENNIREDTRQEYEERLKKALEALRVADRQAKEDAKKQLSDADARI